MKTEQQKKEILSTLGYFYDDLAYLKLVSKVIWKMMEEHPDYNK